MMMNWTTIDGRSWQITVGDKTASVWLRLNNTNYYANVWQINNTPVSLTRFGEFGCIKEAKKACLDEIERINAQEEAEELSAMLRESDPNIDDGMPA
jgi:hypothetical protein